MAFSINKNIFFFSEFKSVLELYYTGIKNSISLISISSEYSIIGMKFYKGWQQV